VFNKNHGTITAQFYAVSDQNAKKAAPFKKAASKLAND
jgi:hypothetical protein